MIPAHWGEVHPLIAWEVKPSTPTPNPSSAVFSIYIFAVNILPTAGENLQPYSTLQTVLSDIKVKILINSWHFYEFFFLDVPSGALCLIDTLSF